MLLALSHGIAFVVLSVNSYFDVFSEKGDVPDIPALIGIVAGIALHAAYSYQLARWTPFLWMMGTGTILSLYGWLAYYRGLWGGADAMALSVIGFAAPYAVSGPDMLYPLNFLVNMMLIGLFYTLAFAFRRAYSSEGFGGELKQRVIKDKRKILLQLFGALILSFYVSRMGMNPLRYLAALIFVILLYPFLKVIEEFEMTKKMPVEDLEGGEVVAEEGKVIKGIEEEDIEDLDVDEVEVMKGIRFIPVFPATLVVTDLIGGGVPLLLQIF